jgi:hypothetical protein
MTTPATPPTPPTLTDVADDVGSLEMEFKSGYAALSAGTKKLITDALAAAKAEGSTVFAALHATTVTTVTK